MDLLLPASTVMPVLTEPDLIRGAQQAIAGGRLGIQRGATEPLFVDHDGSVCAIGAALPPPVLQAILRNGHERLNWLELVRGGYFTHADLRTVEALTTLQLGYDACFEGGRASDLLTRQFCGFISSLDPHPPPQMWRSELS
jgi:hypothetical protein